MPEPCLHYGDGVLTRTLQRHKPPSRWSYGAAWLFAAALGRCAPWPQSPLAKRREIRWTGLACENAERFAEAVARTSLRVLAAELHQSVEVIVRCAARGGRIRIFTRTHTHVARTAPFPLFLPRRSMVDALTNTCAADACHPRAILKPSSVPQRHGCTCEEPDKSVALTLAFRHPLPSLAQLQHSQSPRKHNIVRAVRTSH